MRRVKLVNVTPLINDTPFYGTKYGLENMISFTPSRKTVRLKTYWRGLRCVGGSPYRGLMYSLKYTCTLNCGRASRFRSAGYATTTVESQKKFKGHPPQMHSTQLGNSKSHVLIAAQATENYFILNFPPSVPSSLARNSAKL